MIAGSEEGSGNADENATSTADMLARQGAGGFLDVPDSE
jgi:hypothetical protein